MSFREHLVDMAARGHAPVFTATRLEPLEALDRLFAATTWYSLDVNKELPADEFAPQYAMTAVRILSKGDEPEVFTCSWDPVGGGNDPLTGFRRGPDSTVFGSAPSITMPGDERTAALLLLVTSDFVHLSASREQDPSLIRGAINGRGDGYDYVILDRD